jgi:hypothetical protein
MLRILKKLQKYKKYKVTKNTNDKKLQKLRNYIITKNPWTPKRASFCNISQVPSLQDSIFHWNPEPLDYSIPGANPTDLQLQRQRCMY